MPRLAGKQTRDVCGLDRPDLEDDRRLWLVMAVDTVVKAYQLAVHLNRRDETHEFGERLRKLLEPSMPYVAMTRDRLAALDIAPETLGGPGAVRR